MDKEAYEQYELQEALIETWGQLHEAHLILEGEPPDAKFYGEHLADVIARLQAYGPC